MHWHLLRVTFLVALIASASCSGKKDEADSTADSSAPDSLAAEGRSPEESRGQLADTLDRLATEAGKLPRADFDPAARAASLGADPQRHFEWVRDNTSWAPYRGLLRGAQGVMLDRVGSNLDRAVLLGDLLRHAGHEVRLARAQLSAVRARELLDKVRPMPAKRHATNTSAQTRQVLEAATSLANSQAEQLRSAIAGVTGRQGATDEASRLAALRDHWWVELNEGGRWIAMDVLLPDAKAGELLTAATSTSEWPAKSPFPAIPDDDWHVVRLQVVVERYENGKTTEGAALDAILYPARVLDRPVRLTHIPDPWPESLPDPASDPNAIGNAATNVRQWVPVLRVGDEFISQSGFTEGGDLKANPFAAEGTVEDLGGSMFGGFEGQLSGDAAAASYVTAEWIDYEVQVPGERRQRVRRPLFDLLGPAKRASGTAGFDPTTNELLIRRYEALLGRTDILLQTCDLTGEFVAHLMTASILANQAALRDLSRERDADKARAAAAAILERIDFWSPLPDLALWRSALSGQAIDWYVDRPNILGFRTSPPVVNADREYSREMIDIAFNPIGMRHGASGDAFDVRLRQGVADTVAEMVALGLDLDGAANTASLFAAAGEGHGTVIPPGNAESISKLGWPEGAAEQLREDIEAGMLALALSQPVALANRQRTGWWQVDPATGVTIGVMDTGYHAATTEDQLKRHKVALQQFLSKDASYWRMVRRDLANPRRRHLYGAQTHQQLWMREAAAEVIRDIVRLGL